MKKLHLIAVNPGFVPTTLKGVLRKMSPPPHTQEMSTPHYPDNNSRVEVEKSQEGGMKAKDPEITQRRMTHCLCAFGGCSSSKKIHVNALLFDDF